MKAELLYNSDPTGISRDSSNKNELDCAGVGMIFREQ